MACICSEVRESHHSPFQTLVIIGIFFKSQMFKSLGKVFESVLKVSVEFILHISDSLESSVRARKIGFPLKAIESFIQELGVAHDVYTLTSVGKGS